MADEQGQLVAFDPTWPRQFEEGRALLETVLAPWIVGTIEHIGSTAVPALGRLPHAR